MGATALLVAAAMVERINTAAIVAMKAEMQTQQAAVQLLSTVVAAAQPAARPGGVNLLV